MLLIEDRQGRPVAVQPTRWQLVRARLSAQRLDRELTRGVSADASLELAVRAEWLMREGTRLALADGVTRLLAASERGCPGAPVRRHVVRAVRPQLRELRARLEDGRPVSARGVACATELLTDGSGPMYRATSSAALHAAIGDVLDALDQIA